MSEEGFNPVGQFNPVAVEQAIREVSERISRGVKVCAERYAEFLTADREYDVAFARSYMEAGGAAHERRYIAELATSDRRQVRDVADAAYRYADRRSRALQDELRAWQSVGASTRMMWAVAGRGEP